MALHRDKRTVTHLYLIQDPSRKLLADAGSTRSRQPPWVFEARLSDGSRAILKYADSDGARYEIKAECEFLQRSYEEKVFINSASCLPELLSSQVGDAKAAGGVFVLLHNVPQLYHPLSVHVGRKASRVTTSKHTTSGNLGWRFLARALQATASVLTDLHAAGYVHGDISPNNIVTGPAGEVVVIDWASVCKLGSARRSLTATRMFLSTNLLKALQEGSQLPNSSVRDDVEALFWTVVYVAQADHSVFQSTRLSAMTNARQAFWDRASQDTQVMTHMLQTDKWQKLLGVLDCVASLLAQDKVGDALAAMLVIEIDRDATVRRRATTGI